MIGWIAQDYPCCHSISLQLPVKLLETSNVVRSLQCSGVASSHSSMADDSCRIRFSLPIGIIPQKIFGLSIAYFEILRYNSNVDQ
jgi:hypothetical protein